MSGSWLLCSKDLLPNMAIPLLLWMSHIRLYMKMAVRCCFPKLFPVPRLQNHRYCPNSLHPPRHCLLPSCRSILSSHWTVPSSLLSFLLEQPESLSQSVNVSPSLSVPSLYCVIASAGKTYIHSDKNYFIKLYGLFLRCDWRHS